MGAINRQWVLKRRPQGKLSMEDFEYREIEVPDGDLEPDEIRVRNVAFLCAPTMRNWMDPPGNSLHPTTELGEPVLALAVGRVVASAAPDLPVGSRVSMISSWQDYATITETTLRPPTLLIIPPPPIKAIHNSYLPINSPLLISHLTLHISIPPPLNT